MSWSEVLALGSGRFELRLVVEGWPQQFCTDGLDAGLLSDGRRRIKGMLRDGMRIEERARLAEGDSDRSGFSVSLVDLEAEYTSTFTGSPIVSSWLVGTFATTDTTIKVQDTTNFNVGDYIHVGTECMQITVIPNATDLQVTRARWDSIAQLQTSAAGAGVQFPEVTSVPQLLTGRRCYLYAHGPNELGTADGGTLIYRGVLTDEARLANVTTWTLEIDSLLSLLDQDISAKYEALQITGIYYPASSSLHLQWWQGTTALRADLSLGTKGEIWLTGFYADQRTFATALDAAIAAEMATQGQTGTLRCHVEGNSDWWLEYVPAAVSPLYISARGGSLVDGVTRYALVDADGDDVRGAVPVAGGVTYTIPWGWWETGTYFTTHTMLYGYSSNWPWNELRGVPRTSYGGVSSPDPAAPAAFPDNVIYLARAFDLNANDSITITPWDNGIESTRSDLERLGFGGYTGTVQSVTPATGALELVEVLGGAAKPIPTMSVLPNFGPEISATAVFGFGPTDLSGFRDHLVAFSPGASPGTMPLVTSTDFEDISSVVAAAAAGRHFLTQRVYAFTKPVKLLEMIAQECRMLGCYLCTNATGQLTVKPIRVTVSTDLIGEVISTDDRIVSDGFGSIEINADAVINRAEIKTGYNRTSNKHEGATFVVRDVRSISRLRREHTLEIKPPVKAEAPITAEDNVEDIPAAAFGVMSDRYLIASVDVSWRKFSAELGDTVSVDAPQLPFGGFRGLNTQGLVVGRQWDFTDAFGSLEILIMDQPFAGYAPSARITAAAGAGVAWTLNLTANHYAPTVVDDVLFFLIGYQVQLVEWNAAAPTIRTGVITNIVGNAVDVTLTGAWAGLGGATYNLLFDDYATATADQLQYAYTADAVGKLGGAADAKVFAP